MKKNIRVRGINMVYDDIGSGEVIVFIHGQPFNRTMWRYQIDDFSQTHRLIIPDLRGYGETDVTERVVLLDEIALDLMHLLEELAINKAIFVGLSMGGQIAFELYRMAPHLFKGMVLADTEARAETSEGYINRIQLAEKILKEGLTQFTAERIDKFICKETFDTKPHIVGHLTQMMTSTSAVGSSAVQRGRAERRDHTAILPSISIPTLIIVGDQDEFTPPTTAQYMNDRITGSQLVIIDASGHIPNMEQPEIFNNQLRAFLQTLTGD